MKKLISNILSQFSIQKIELPAHEKFQKIINYNFSNKTLLTAALTHTSYINSANPATPFERMEFLGDSVLGLIISEELFLKYPNHTEGQLSKLKSKIVSRKFLAMIAKDIGLADYILLSAETIQDGGKNSGSILADTMESLICAIYLDGKISQARKFIKKFVLKDFKTLILNENLINYKSILQEYTQSKSQMIPNYKIVKEIGPDHEKTFFMDVFIDKKFAGTGKGANKKDAQQDAAKDACLKLKLLV